MYYWMLNFSCRSLQFVIQSIVLHNVLNCMRNLWFNFLIVCGDVGSSLVLDTHRLKGDSCVNMLRDLGIQLSSDYWVES